MLRKEAVKMEQVMFEEFGVVKVEKEQYKAITYPVVSKLMMKMRRIKVPIVKAFEPAVILRKADGREVRFNGLR
jgi:propanediol dehydratase large subunit